jgi:hypothetical protein
MVWLVIAACTSPRDRGGPPGVGAHTDSSAPRTPVEDAGSATKAAAPVSPQSAPAASIPLSPAAESATVIGQRFQAAREAVNAAAIALDTLPPSARFTPAYAARFDSIRVLTLHADSLRSARDRWRHAAARVPGAR